MFRYRKQKKFVNPFFPKHRKKKSIKKIIFFLLIFFLTNIGFLFFSPYFKVSDIQVAGNSTINSETIINFTKENIPRWSNLLILNQNDLSKKILENFSFEIVSIEKTWPNKISIQVNDYAPYAIWKSGEKIFLVERNGNILRQISNIEEGNGFILILDDDSIISQRNQYISLNKAIFDAFELVKISLQNINIPLNYAKILDISGSNIKLITNESWEIIINPFEDVEKQVEKLNVVLNRIPNRSLLHYIDLRFEDRIYYK